LVDLEISVGIEGFEISIGYAAYVGAKLFAPTGQKPVVFSVVIY